MLGCRELNTRSFPEYLRRVVAGASATIQSESLLPAERARETLHSTAADAAQVALAAQVGMLALTHVSTRYFGPELAREARAIFPETVVPRDFDVIELPFPERGGPQLVKGGALGDRSGEPVSSAAE